MKSSQKSLQSSQKSATAPSSSPARSRGNSPETGLQQGSEQSSARELTQRVMKVQQHCMADFASQLNEAKLSYAQYYLLGVLSEVEGLSMGEIAERMGHSTAAATGLVDRLERLEFVERRTSSKDRRRIIVAIADKGNQCLSELNDSMVNSVAKLLASEEG